MEEYEALLESNSLINDNPKATIDQEEYLSLLGPSRQSSNPKYRGKRLVGHLGIGDSQFDDGVRIEQIDEEGGINRRRADLQPWTDQLGNAITQAVVGEVVGGTIEGVGYLMDWQGMANLVTGDEKEFTNWFSDIGKSIRENTQEATQIYEENPGEMNLSDPGYWFKNSVSVASTLSMMVPAMGATRGLSMLARGGSKLLAKGVSKGAKKIGKNVAEEAVDLSQKMGVRADWAANGMTQAVVSRHIENSMESSGTFDQIYQERLKQKDPETGELFTEDKARESASIAAAENYKHGWAMLAQDMVQYMGIGKVFNPLTKQMETARKIARGAGKSAGKKILQGAGTFASEAAEEGYQGYISSRAGLRSDLRAGLITQEEYDEELSKILGSDESLTSMLFGGLGGSVFSMVGPAANKMFKSKEKKGMEDAASEMFEESINTRNKMYSALNVEKARAEKEGDVEGRQMAMDNIITNMVLDGIENDNLEMVMMAIKDGPEMTKEELANFEEANGYKWDQELAKEGAERAIEKANKIKAIHYKTLSKARNKKTSPSILKTMTLKEFQNQEFAEMYDNQVKETKKLVDGIRYDGIRKPTQNFKEKAAVESEIAGTKRLVDYYEKVHNDLSDGSRKSQLAKAIKDHRSDIVQLEKNLKELNEPSIEKEKSRDEKTGDKKAAGVYNIVADDVIEGISRQKEINDQINFNNDDISKLYNKDYQREHKKNEISRAIDVANKDQASELKDNLSEGKIDGVSEKEAEEFIDRIDKRLATLKSEKVAQEKEKQAAIDKKALLDKVDKKNDDPAFTDNNVNPDVTESIEDEYSNEEIDFEERFEDESTKSLEKNTSDGKSISLLDGVDENNQKIKDITSSDYDKWINSGKNKIGTKVTYKYSVRGIQMNPKMKDHPISKAVNEFNKAKETGGELSENVYRYYPIQAFIGDGDSIWTRLPAYPGDSASPERIEMYETNYQAERKAIIDSIFRGIEPVTEIKYTAGGQLVTQFDENGFVAENNVKDIKAVKNTKKRPHIVYSDSSGYLREMDKKHLNEDFQHKPLSVGLDENGNRQPYRGGLFVILNKADGTPFPARLNFLKNTREEADVLADILLDIAVPNPNENKKYKLSDNLDQVDSELRERIETHLPKEVAFLKGKKGNKSVVLKDLLNMFIYASERTQGLSSELYMKYNNLYFGSGENHTIISPNDKVANRQKLVDFLTDTKRRQLNINMWNDTSNFPGYRDFMLDNKIINTNIVTGDAETFQKGKYIDNSGNERTRYVKAFAAPIKSAVSSTSPKVVDPLQGITPPETGSIIKDGPTEKEINEAFESAIPGKNYRLGIKDGKTIYGVTVPKEDMDVLNSIREGMSQPTQQTGDTQVRNVELKDVSSIPVKKERPAGRRRTSGKLSGKKKPNKRVSDDNIKRNDDTGSVKKDCKK